ncbi:MAG TPA: response regulator [Gemmatimonadales bacterium]|jgi:CheY-like chemotaxis protein
MSPHDFPLALFRPPIVLVVENRPSLHSPTGRLVGMLGYEVRRARTGEQALGLVRQHRGLFDLVLTNILLPDVDGGDFVQRVRREEPGIRVAWIADYAPIGRAAALVASYPEVSLIRKPFGFRELRDALLPLIGPPRAAVPLADTLRSPRHRVRKPIR